MGNNRNGHFHQSQNCSRSTGNAAAYSLMPRGKPGAVTGNEAAVNQAGTTGYPSPRTITGVSGYCAADDFPGYTDDSTSMLPGHTVSTYSTILNRSGLAVNSTTRSVTYTIICNRTVRDFCMAARAADSRPAANKQIVI